ncbi:flavin reductase family protein [Phytoactinopolyspora halophila]|uniref:flavin reductase family protein n=1 Tax=Phytoactinopolyspora halophila TaxID=1981511 RepID=UPI001313F7A3|nr:flavin reductase family protein [Phytoactinopolyspora halophila]
MRDAPDFRDAMARLGSGVGILTTLDPIGRDCGLTVSAVSAVSLDPPLVLVCVKKDGFIHDAIYVADGWSLTFLAVDQLEVARYCARHRHPGARDDFSAWTTRRTDNGELIFTGGVAAVECAPYQFVDAGDHTIAIGEVVRVPADMRGETPLLHVDRAYVTPGDIVD